LALILEQENISTVENKMNDSWQRSGHLVERAVHYVIHRRST